MYWNKELDQIETESFAYYYYEEDGFLHLDLKTIEGKEDESYLGNICSANDGDWKEKVEEYIREFESSQENISFGQRLNTDTRTANISIAKRGGTAGKGSVGYRLILPNIWMNQMGISEEDRKVSISFDGEEIKIRRSK